MTKKKLLYFASRRPDYSQIGEVPSVVFFGSDRLRDNLDFIFDFAWRRNYFLRVLWYPFERYFIRRVGVGFRLDQAITNFFLLRKQDIIFAETDSCGLPLLLLKRLGIIRAKVGFNSAGLINNLESQKGTRFFGFCKLLLKAADFIVCWSPLEEKMYKELTGARAQFVLLEADTVFYKPDFCKPLGDFILCVGNDVDRDFKTLFRATERLAIPIKVVTKVARVRGLSIPKNVELHTEFVSYPKLLDWYQNARLVVVNLKEANRFTGQRALLESLAMGKATIAARTAALESAYQLKSGKNVIFYEPGDEVGLRRLILEYFSRGDDLREIGRNARLFVEHLPVDSYYRGVLTLMREK